MSLFNISGSGNWEVSEAAEALCQNFDKDNVKKKNRKAKNKIKNLVAQSNFKKVIKKFGAVGEPDKITNGKNRLIKKAKKKSKANKHTDSETLLTNSFNTSDIAENTPKKGLKRKHTSTSDENKHLIKKSKKEVNGPGNSMKIHNNDDALQSVDRAEKKPSKKRKNNKLKKESQQVEKIDPANLKKRKQQLQKLHDLLSNKEQKQSKKQERVMSLREKMMRKLKAARFRFLNEQIYSTTGKETEKIFRQDPEAFKAYHEGYKLQVKRWPLNPLDKIIKTLNKMNKAYIVADFGCGEARLAKSIEQKVHSFDLVAVNDTVTPCDMAHVPLEDSSVDVAVFCLSLMGTNLKDYLLEANRVLKEGSLLKIAEVESRFEDINSFIKDCEKFGFKKTWMDLSHNLFYFIDFKKVTNAKNKNKLPSVRLQPCLYKKR